MPVPCEFPSPMSPRTTAFSPTPRKDADRVFDLSARLHLGDLAELRAEELAIREKFGLPEGTPLHDVARRGSPLL
jgi:hypothetical protein